MKRPLTKKVRATAGRELWGIVSSFLFVLSWMHASSFNLDTDFPVVFSGPERSYFGYTVAMTPSSSGYIALVGAPRANSTSYPRSYESGFLFYCQVKSNSCAEYDVFELNPLTHFHWGPPRKYYRTWLGVSLDVNSKLNAGNKNIMVCAHRYYESNYLLNGACYFVNQDMKRYSLKLSLLQESGKEYVYDSRDNAYHSYYANGQGGMSALYSELGTYVMIGAPGFFEGTGALIYYNLRDLSKYVFSSEDIDRHSYFGYSIAKGNFYRPNAERYAVGAPREENHGKVHIVEFSSTGEKIYFLQSLKGSELGEYFGASVLGVDLDGDQYADLVVGAPLYAQEFGSDEGKVYVYLGDQSKMRLQTELFGDKKSDARFGTALASTGDLNQDGFGDIAVGAPYEDERGAVYIYYGSNIGLNTKYSQKIEAIQIHPNLAGFGIHISRGLDIDDNGYPDVLVGSYVSSNAVLLKSRPVIEVFLALYFNPSKIRMNKADCIYEGKNLPCIHVDACLNYTGKQVPVSLDFELTLTEQDSNPRGFFLPYRYKNTAIHRNSTVKINTDSCLTLQFYLHSDIKDIVSPILIHFSSNLAPSTASNDTFDNYPVVSPFSVQNITREIPFHSGCANDSVCYSDLAIQAEVIGLDKDNKITVGNVTSISIEIAVWNEGEPAYSSELFINLPPEVRIINEDFCETKYEPQEEIVRCDLGNPLVKGRQVNIQLKLDITKISPHTKFLEIFFDGRTNSSEINPDDNIITLSLEVQTISDIEITGSPSHYLILYHKNQEMSSIINHRYIIRNYGPSPVRRIDINFQVPKAILSSEGWKTFLYFTGLKTDSESDLVISALCNDTSLGIEKLLTPSK